jgi:accessory gene regulator B
MGRLETILINSGRGDRLTLTKLRYGLEVAKNEAIKIIILFILFAFLDHQTEFIFAVVLLLPVRSFSGGMHMQSSISCFFYSLFFFVLAVEILPQLPTPVSMQFVILGIAVFSIALVSPVASYKRPIKTKERIIASKKGVAVFLGVDTVVLLLLWRSEADIFFVIGVWVVTLQAIQLIATWVYRKLKGERNVRENKNMETVTDGNVGP